MKGNDCCCGWTLFISFITVILGCVFYFPIEYAIYYPFFNHDWKSAKCMVDNIQRYRILQSVDKAGNKYYSYYSLFDIRIYINERWLQAFACGCSDATGSSAGTVINGVYPYQYSVCVAERECLNMLMMPVWFCNECKNCQDEFNGELQDCKWFLKKGNNEIDDVNDISVGYQLDYPTIDSTFIQAMFMDSPFYYQSDYLGLQVICLYLMIYVPSGFILISLFYFLSSWLVKKC